MRKKAMYILMILSLSLVLSSCSTKPQISNNSKDDKAVINDKINNEKDVSNNTNEDGLMDKIFLSLDGKYSSIYDIPLRKRDEVWRTYN